MKPLTAVGALVLFAAFIVATAVSPLRPLGDGTWFAPAYDFSLRMSEAACLRMGINPYDVWHGDVVQAPFVPNWGEPREAVLGREGFTEDINAYAPWEYAMVLPLSFLPRRVAWGLYFALMMGCLAILFEVGRRVAGATVSALALLAVAYPVWSNVCIGNFSVVVLAALALMAVCLAHGRDVLAGFCWAVAMLKPQLGLIFAVPLLMRRKWVTCFVAAGTCALLSVPPALMCCTSPLTLILQTPAAAAYAFDGCGTMPYGFLSVLPQTVAINLGLVLGASLCAWMTWMVGRSMGFDTPARRACQTSEAKPSESNSWFLYLMPAAMCATTWTYAMTYGHALNWFYFLVLFAALARSQPRTRFVRALVALSLLSVTRLYRVYYASLVFLGDRFPALRPSPALHLHLDSLNSTLDLILCVALCLWLARRTAKRPQ